jgi:hypothetical protein
MVSSVFQKPLFEPLFCNFNEKQLQKCEDLESYLSEFKNTFYDLKKQLFPYMKCIKENLTEEYFVDLVNDLTIYFINEYIV